MKSKDLIDELMALQFLKQQEVYELKLQLLGLSRSNAQKVVGLLCRSKCEVISIFAQEIERKFKN